MLGQLPRQGHRWALMEAVAAEAVEAAVEAAVEVAAEVAVEAAVEAPMEAAEAAEVSLRMQLAQAPLLRPRRRHRRSPGGQFPQMSPSRRSVLDGAWIIWPRTRYDA